MRNILRRIGHSAHKKGLTNKPRDVYGLDQHVGTY